MIYGVLLAAGTSSRMGQPKQLLSWQGRPLIRHAAETALASGLAGLVVVLGAEAQAARGALAGLAGPVVTVECEAYATGQAASLRCGLGALPVAARAAVVLLVDQPLVSSGVIDRLIAIFEASPNAKAVVPRYQGRRGNPVLLAAALFPELQLLAGDVGARAVLAAHAEAVRWLDLDDPAVLLDADTPEMFAQLRRQDEGQDERSSP